MSHSELDDHAYVIASGASATDRLELLAEVFAPITKSFLERIGRVDSFLDVGCGLASVATEVMNAGAARVVAADINAEVIEAARQRTPAMCVVASVDELGNEPLTDFDVVYARCVLSHLPDPVAALTRMTGASKPGGLVAVEDVQVARVWSAPPLTALQRHVDLYVQAARIMGASPDLAQHLPEHMSSAGLTDISVTVLQPLLTTARARSIYAVTMNAIGDAVVGAGLATADEVDSLTRQLASAARSDSWYVTLPLVVQVTGRIPY